MAAPTGPLLTQVDRDLAGVPRGDELTAAAGALRARNNQRSQPPTYAPEQPAAGELALTWGDLQQRHPDWRGDYWAECRALYGGGERLLCDPDVLKRLFPQNLHEDPLVYKARQARAHYFPYPGTIIDHMLAGLGSDPLTVSFHDTDDKGAVSKPPPAAAWWEEWVEDVTDEAEQPADYGLTGDADADEDDDEGGKPLHEFLVEALREALQTRTAWVLTDLPEADPDAVIDSQLAVEREGLNDPYLCLVPAEQVIDWRCDKRDRLEWVMTLTIEQPRVSPRDRRGNLLHTYTLWTPDIWAKYEIAFDPRQPPHESKLYTPVVGAHGFGRVPFERLMLPDGLFAMGKLHSLAREHFNKRCAMGWAEYRSLYSQLYEFNAPEDGPGGGMPVAEAQMDPNRATNQIRGVGYTQVRGDKDRAEYVGPPPEVFVAARDSCNDAMREMHRVMFSMALSADMDSRALNRSAESKGKDEATTSILLNAFGKILLKFARRLLVLASLGRQEAVPKAQIAGLEDFDVESTTAAINEAVAFFSGVPQMSPLVKELYLAKTYQALLTSLTPEQVETMRKEIRDGLSAEEMAAQELAGMGAQGGAGPDGQAPDGKPGEPTPMGTGQGAGAGGVDKPA